MLQIFITGAECEERVLQEGHFLGRVAVLRQGMDENVGLHR